MRSLRRTLVSPTGLALLLGLFPALPSPSAALEPPTAAVFRENGFPARGAPSSPEAMAAALRAGGLDVAFLDAEALADPSRLAPGLVDLVVLTCGRSFPAAARENFLAYLRGGGDFISVGGYAFSDLYLKDGGAWVLEKDAIARRLEAALRDGPSLLADGDFEAAATRGAPVGPRVPVGTKAPDGAIEAGGRWFRTSADCEVVEESPRSGRACARAVARSVDSGAEWSAEVRVHAGEMLRVRGWLRTEGIEGPGYAYLAVYQHAADGRLLAFRDFAQSRGTTPWTLHEHEVEIAAGAERLALKAGVYNAAGRAWYDGFRLIDVTGLRARPMNTATGSPQDGLVVSPDQIGAFDAAFPLRRVARVVAAPGQAIVPAGVAGGPVSGWAATGVVGPDDARWVSLIDARDRYGRLRGSAGAMLLHHAGRFSGSAWAMFGVESEDLFARAGDRGDPWCEALGEMARFLVRSVWLRGLRSDFASYAAGSKARVSVTVEDRGRAPVEGRVSIRAFDEGTATPFAFATRDVRVQAGESMVVEEAIELPEGPLGTGGALVHLEAELALDGKVWDRVESGLAVVPEKFPESPPLAFADNYLRIGDRPMFLFGSDSYSNVYSGSSHGPLTWSRDLGASRDFGFQIYENLQYVKRDHVLEESDWRRFRAMAWMAHRSGLVFMPGILIGHDVAVSDARIAEESRLCRQYAARLKDVPRLLWYINGDYQLRHDDPEMLREKWNAFLRGRHGGDEGLWAAWGDEAIPPTLGKVPFPPLASGRWDSPAAVDLHRFHLKLMADWNAAHVAAIRAEDALHPITSEYYQQPFSGIDLRLTIDGQDLSNIGYFDEPGRDIDELPWKIRWNDLRAEGKSVGLGEYGVKTHPAWSRENGATGYHIARTEDEERRLFAAVAFLSFGLGCSKVQSWCLKDSEERVFPWGAFYPGPVVPKDVAHVHRNLSLLFRLFEPRHIPPPLTVILCDALRVGNEEDLGRRAGYAAFEALLGLHADFNVLGDTSLDRMPESTRAAILPAGLAMSDASFEALLRWVERGGCLLLSGGCVRDEDRRATRAERMERLAGVRFLGVLMAPGERASARLEEIPVAEGSGLPRIAAARWATWEAHGAEVLLSDASGSPLLTRFSSGRGIVVLCGDPLELDGPAGSIRELYRWFLGQAGIPTVEGRPDSPDFLLLSQPTRTGTVHVGFARGSGMETREVSFPTGAGGVTLGLAAGWPGLAAVSDDGEVTAVAASRGVDGPLSVTMDALSAIASLEERGIRASSAMLLLPCGAGAVSIPSDRLWTSPVAWLGDIDGGRFRVLEKVALAGGGPDASRFRIEFDEDRATLLGILCEEAEAPRWAEELSRLVSEPELVRGR